LSLSEYRRKRNAKLTPEPFAGSKRDGKAPIFVVQRHDARRLHYDFRLERNGALASWAVPKGVPLEPGARALAVHVEDHPLAYATFEGEIPKGQYGAGSVEVWDHGVYALLEEKPNGQLTVRLQGEKLKGDWSLIPAQLDGKPQNWLLIKRSGAETETSSPGGSPIAYSPMLASVDERAPTGEQWLFEVKFDGYRALAYIRDGECRLISRNENDLTGRFPGVAKEVVKATKSPNAVLDGELCRLDSSGRSSFSELQQGSGPLVFYAFDLLELDHEPLIALPLHERKSRLQKLLDGRNRTVRFSVDFDDGEALLAAGREQGLEGIIAKRSSSRYASGKRTRDWLKIKLHNADEFVVAGYTRGAGRRDGTFGALVLAVNEESELRYVGNVGTGFSDAEIDKLLALLKPLKRDSPPFATPPKMARVPKTDVQWVEPQLVVQVRYGEWTHDGRLRHPAYLGLREDRPVNEVTRPQPASEQPATEILREGARELRLSNLKKLFWPEQAITKGDLISYYQAVAPVLVPHLEGRPFTMRRYPDGAAGKAFFQKDAPKHMPDWIPTFHALVSARAGAPTKKWIDFPVVNDELALLWMVNMGCIDMNAWYSRIDKPESPDFVLFDLDPTPEVPWSETIQVALILKGLLDQLELQSFPKTSGGKGFHVLVPLDRKSTYDEARSFAEVVAAAIARTHPKLATTEWSKTKRRGVLIDSNQNGQGKTIASAYSVRPRPSATVSTPLAWNEVNDRLDPAAFTMAAVLERVRTLGDLFAGVLTTPQSLSQSLSRLAGGTLVSADS
jgi:bifunctional non-homologous end joining protein LigD